MRLEKVKIEELKVGEVFLVQSPRTRIKEEPTFGNLFWFLLVSRKSEGEEIIANLMPLRQPLDESLRWNSPNHIECYQSALELIPFYIMRLGMCQNPNLA
jgi:hypothetical protein